MLSEPSLKGVKHINHMERCKWLWLTLEAQEESGYRSSKVSSMKILQLLFPAPFQTD